MLGDVLDILYALVLVGGKHRFSLVRRDIYISRLVALSVIFLIIQSSFSPHFPTPNQADTSLSLLHYIDPSLKLIMVSSTELKA
jgi:hypothetical protein